MKFFEVFEPIFAIINTKCDGGGRRLHMPKVPLVGIVLVTIGFIEPTSAVHLSTSGLLIYH